MEKNNQKVPKGALRFVAQNQTACAFADNEGGKEKIRMTVYSGQMIANHWYWGNLIMDLEGVKFNQDHYPILEDHDTRRKIGFHKKPIVNENGIILNPETSGFVDTPESQEFRKLSKEGFPYQSSLYGRPLKIQRFGENEEVVVNGHKVKGPGSVWRVWEFKESSVCVFGWDSRTKATAFSRDETEEVEFSEDRLSEEAQPQENLKGGEKIMDIKELQEKHPEVFAQVVAQGKEAGKAEAEGKFSTEKTALQTQLDTLGGRLAKTEKDLAISRENQQAVESNTIFKEVFSESSIDERLESKVRIQLDHRKFVKNDVLNTEAFRKAVQDEVKDWESKLKPSSVKGFSANTDPENDTEEDETKFAENNKAVTSDLLSRVGQKPEEKK